MRYGRKLGKVNMSIEMLEEVIEYLRSNVPGDGWGCLDKGADRERMVLIRKLNSVLDDLLAASKVSP